MSNGAQQQKVQVALQQRRRLLKLFGYDDDSQLRELVGNAAKRAPITLVPVLKGSQTGESVLAVVFYCLHLGRGLRSNGTPYAKAKPQVLAAAAGTIPVGVPQFRSVVKTAVTRSKGVRGGDDSFNLTYDHTTIRCNVPGCRYSAKLVTDNHAEIVDRDQFHKTMAAPVSDRVKIKRQVYDGKTSTSVLLQEPFWWETALKLFYDGSGFVVGDAYPVGVETGDGLQRTMANCVLVPVQALTEKAFFSKMRSFSVLDSVDTYNTD